MKKILSLLGAMVLSTTASASITACGSAEEPKPTPPVPPSPVKIDLNTNTLKSNLHFLKVMTGEKAYNELRSKIKVLSGNVYKNIDEIRNDDTILISIWVAPNNCLSESILNAFAFVNRVDVKIKVKENNKVFKKMNLITLSQIEVFNS